MTQVTTISPVSNLVDGRRTSVRQGDVMLVPVDALPEGLVDAPRDSHGHILLAVGEHSGHRHTIRDRSVASLRMAGSEDTDYVLVGGSGAVFAHEYLSGEIADHQPVMLAPGPYRVAHPSKGATQREYSPRGIVRAQD
jgi:hypothetical protein